MPKIKLEREYVVAKLPNFEKRFEIVSPNLDLGFHLVAFLKPISTGYKSLSPFDAKSDVIEQ
jgi:hypothetical protein